MYTTRVSHRVRAPRSAIYRALLDADAIARWRVLDGMSGQVHELDAREGGFFRVSLSCDAPDGPGKSAQRTDTYDGHFVSLTPDERVVEALEFETEDPALRVHMLHCGPRERRRPARTQRPPETSMTAPVR
jgi:uncharacterized protein YndB with AHSA1/START domain